MTEPRLANRMVGARLAIGKSLMHQVSKGGQECGVKLTAYFRPTSGATTMVWSRLAPAMRGDMSPVVSRKRRSEKIRLKISDAPFWFRNKPPSPGQPPKVCRRVNTEKRACGKRGIFR